MPSLRGATAVALAALCACPPMALAHKGNPNYSSEVRSIEPAVDGLAAEILSNDDRIELRNNSDSVVVVEGYRNEPYLRFLPDGTVQENRRSPATYLNEDRFAAGRGARLSAPQRAAGLAAGRAERALRLARPSHPLDVEDAAEAGPRGRVQALQDLRLDAADGR